MKAPTLGELLRPAAGAVGAATAIGILTSVATAALVVVAMEIIRHGPQGRFGWLVGLALARAVLAAATPPVQAATLAMVRRRAQSSFYRFLLASRAAVTDLRRSGDLASVATTGVERVAALAATFLPLLGRGVVVPLVVGIYALTIDVAVGMVMLAALPVVGLALRGMESAFRGTGDTLRRAQDDLSAAFLDALGGLETLVLFGADDERAETLSAQAEEVRVATMDVLRVAQRSLISVDLAYSLVSVVAVVAVLLLRLEAGAVDGLAAVTLLFLSVVAVSALVDLVSFFYVGGLGLAAYRRLREVWGLLPEPKPLSTPPGEGLVLAEVTYTYPGGTRPALEEVSFEISLGERVAVVGPSGAGKSTLADICRGLRVPERGGVSVMGRPPGPDSVVYVGQSSHVFEGTVSYNLRVARPDATSAELEDACRRARLLEVVEALPDGFATRLGQGGVGLSGGEVQRLALARAFLSPAPLVVLDEATSGLDLETEALVTDAVFELLGGRAALVVAHRVTTARRCDRIIRLEAGKVTAEGSATEMAPLLVEMTGRGP